jgi:Transposase DDE domain
VTRFHSDWTPHKAWLPGARQLAASQLPCLLEWNKARLHCFAGMLLALIRVRTVNLAELACGFESNAQIDSRYRRIRRFFAQFLPKQEVLGRWVMSMFALENKPLTLSIDRTNWQWGKRPINILMLSAVYKGTALPLFWTLLPTKGNSDTRQRIEIMERFIRCFGRQNIACLLGDREFVGDKWVSWLLENKIHFCIRIKGNTVTDRDSGGEFLVRHLFHDLRKKKVRILSEPKRIWNQRLYISALRLASRELLILISDRYLAKPMKLYAKRWEIETLFGCFKSRGFNFEDTNMTHPDRISSLISLVSVAFCWAHRTGEWRHSQKPILRKKHKRRSTSIFRYGLDLLRDCILHFTESVLPLPAACIDFIRKKPKKTKLPTSAKFQIFEPSLKKAL